MNPASERANAPSRLVSGGFGRRIEGNARAVSPAARIVLLACATHSRLQGRPVWIRKKDNVGQSVGSGCWLLNAAANVSLVCRTLCCSVILFE